MARYTILNPPSIPRNKQIASIFKEAAIIEKYGSGIKRVIQTMQNYGANKPVCETIGIFFKVTVTPISDGVTILHSLIQEKSGKRAPFFVTELSTSIKKIGRWLKQLRKEGKVEFRGTPKNGVFFTTKNLNFHLSEFSPQFNVPIQCTYTP